MPPKSTEEVMADMEAAAQAAKTEYEQWYANLMPAERKAVDELAAWFQRWFMAAGYKRLGKILKS